MTEPDNGAIREIDGWPMPPSNAPVRRHRLVIEGPSVLMATAVPAGVAAAYTEKKALQHTISLPARNPNHQYREAQIQVAEALTAGTTTAVLLITGGILKYRAARKARQES